MRSNGIVSLLESIRTHINTHLYHQLLRQVLEGLDLERRNWQLLHSILSGQLADAVENEMVDARELAEAVGALLAFVRAIRSQVCHRLRELLGDILRTQPQERLLRDATLVNFDANVQRLNDLTRQLIREIEDLHPELIPAMQHPDPGELDYGCSARG